MTSARRKAMMIGVMLSLVGLVWGFEESDFQQFIDEAIKAGGGEVVIPPGEHIIRKGLKVKDAKGLKIAGMDKERTILRWDGEGESSGSLIEITGSAEQISLSKLTFVGGSKDLIGIKLGTEAGDKNNIRMEDCLFEGEFERGILIGSVEDVLVERCSFSDQPNVAIEVSKAAKGTKLVGNWMIRTAIAIKVAQAGEVTADFNEFVNVQKIAQLDEGANLKSLENPKPEHMQELKEPKVLESTK